MRTRNKFALYEKGNMVDFDYCSNRCVGEIVKVYSNGIPEDRKNVYFDIVSEEISYDHIKQQDIRPYINEEYLLEENQVYRLSGISADDGLNLMDFFYYDYCEFIKEIVVNFNYKKQQEQATVELHFAKIKEGELIYKWLQPYPVQYVKRTKKGINIKFSNIVWVFEQVIFEKTKAKTQTKEKSQIKTKAETKVPLKLIEIYLYDYKDDTSFEFNTGLRTPVIIYNRGYSDKTIKFTGDIKEWTIKAQKSQKLIPYSLDK